jgi:hypothetical protein
MKKIFQLLLLSCVLICSSSVFAGESKKKEPKSPESIVTCGAGNGNYIAIAEVAEPFSVEQCKPFEDFCAPCITSLEEQGCKIVDVIVTHHAPFITNASYLLSCDSP